MKPLIYLTFLLAIFPIQASERVNNQKVVAIYQLDDEDEAGFDFITSSKIHSCDENPSGRFRSYSNEPLVAERNFLLVLKAFDSKAKLSFRVLSCEGKAMLVDQIGIQR